MPAGALGSRGQLYADVALCAGEAPSALCRVQMDCVKGSREDILVYSTEDGGPGVGGV